VQIDYIQHQKMGHEVSFSASITKKFFGVGALFCVRHFLLSLISVNHEEVTSNWPILFNSGTQLYNGRARHTKCTSVHREPKKYWCNFIFYCPTPSSKSGISDQCLITIYWLLLFGNESQFYNGRGMDTIFTSVHHTLTFVLR